MGKEGGESGDAPFRGGGESEKEDEKECICPVADFESQPCEVQAPKTLYDPLLPTPAEVAAHCVTHRPYRRWCRICVEAWGKEDPHKRAGEGEKEGMPEIGLDYYYLGDPEDEEGQVTVMAMKDRVTGNLWGNVCEKKGPGDRWILDKLNRNICTLGRHNIVLKTDGEPSIVAMQAKIAEKREGFTIPKNPPAYNPESNGPIEKGVQDLNGQTRCVKAALESRIKKKVKASSAVMEWGIAHAGFVVSRFAVGHDGKTPWQRLTGRPWNRPIVEFGEQVLGKLARERMDRKKKSKNANAKRKLTTRWCLGTWVGMVERTGEHVIIAKSSGKAVRVRTIKRVPEVARWDADAILNMKATPRYPDPSNKAQQEVEVQVELDQEGGAEQEKERSEGRKKHFVQATDEPEVSGPRDRDVRELRITQRLLGKFGYTADCIGCNAL